MNFLNPPAQIPLLSTTETIEPKQQDYDFEKILIDQFYSSNPSESLWIDDFLDELIFCFTVKENIFILIFLIRMYLFSVEGNFFFFFGK